MDFDLTPEQMAVRSMAREWALAEVAPVIQRYDEAHEFPRELLVSLAKTGLLGALVPEEYGGAALDYVSYALAVEELNRVDASVGITMWAHNSLCTNHLVLFGSPPQKAAHLPRLARGESLGAWGLTEPGSGSDAAAMKSRAGHVVVAIAHRPRLHGGGVRARARLRQSPCPQGFPAGETRQVGRLLRGGAEKDEVIGAERVVRPHGDAHGGVHPVQLLHGQRVGDVVEGGPAVLFGDESPEEARLGETHEELAGEFVRLVVALDDGSDLGESPFAGHGSHGHLLGREPKVHAASHGGADVLAHEAHDVLGRRAGSEELLHPPGLEGADVLGRDDAAAEHRDVLRAFLLEQLEDTAEQVVVGTGEHAEPDGVGILLDGGGHDLLRGLMQSGVDHLEAGIAQGAGHDLGPAVMPIQSRLGHHHPDLALGHLVILARRTWSGCGRPRS